MSGDARIGSVVAGKYKLQRSLGTGSMGAVYQGVHIEIGKRVAIKLMNPEYANTPELVARFRREARAASAVDSDYIVQVFDAGRDAALGVYMVTELLLGEDLESRLTREKRLDAGTTTLIGYQVARGLARAHAAGVIHRDLKPANVFLTQRDDDSLHSKILDFGISKVNPLLDEAPNARTEANLTQAGMALGTPQYMSPEQAQALPDIDAKTDVWSLAAVLYECLSGAPPFPDTGSYVDVMLSIVRSGAPELARVAPWVPRDLADIIQSALQKDRRRRPDSATFAQLLAGRFREFGLRTSGRMSLVDASERTSTVEDEPSATLDGMSDVSASDHDEDAVDSGIPVSVAFDPEGDDGSPPTERVPAVSDGASVAPPSSSADDQVEIFQRLPGTGGRSSRR